MGCDHPCVYFVFSCGYLGLFLLLVVCSCIYVGCLCVRVWFCFQLFCFGGFLPFCFAGVVTLALTMRTLCHLGVGVESHAPVFLQKV